MKVPTKAKPPGLYQIWSESAREISVFCLPWHPWLFILQWNTCKWFIYLRWILR